MLGAIAPVEALIDKPAGAEYVPPAVPVRFTATDDSEVHNGPVYDIVANGTAVTVILLVADVAGQPPAAAILLVTVYVPAVLVVKFTWPVAALTKAKPAVDEKVPATPPPLNAGDGLVPFLQIGLAG